ncbi:hypothetical protein J4205_00555 [Candidatus Pacearchaeota archaeon]|nr:hypothetical protein [Candidatus Pacearchaeota archaeon]
MLTGKTDLEFRTEEGFIIASLPDYTLGYCKDWKSRREVKINLDDALNNVILCVHPMTDFLDEYSEIKYFYDPEKDGWKAVLSNFPDRASLEYGLGTLEYDVFNLLVHLKKEMGKELI